MFDDGFNSIGADWERLRCGGAGGSHCWKVGGAAYTQKLALADLPRGGDICPSGCGYMVLVVDENLSGRENQDLYKQDSFFFKHFWQNQVYEESKTLGGSKIVPKTDDGKGCRR